ncbi:MarR family transcriptional regulator [Streptomyces sp. NBC_01483]|uniref:MarR family transcriptional regulator n=1 Tax=Streptomyces sp. NBC_01483 TaxID=2903883 RepID=UPI003FCCDD66
MNLRSLGDALASRPSSVSRLCDRMEAVGLIRRVPSSTSRREVEVGLSPLGEQVLGELRDHRARLRLAALSPFVERVLGITGVSGVLPVFRGVEEALEADAV